MFGAGGWEDGPDGGELRVRGESVTVTTARSWWRRGDNNLRAEAQAAKDAAAEAFYELDTAQRDLEISIETISAVDDTPEARRALAGFRSLGDRKSTRLNSSHTVLSRMPSSA